MNAQQHLAGLCRSDGLVKMPDLLLRIRLFKGVDQEIRFEQNLMVDAVNRLVHMVVSNKPANAVDVRLFKWKILENLSRYGRAFYLLELSGRGMMHALSFMNADVMQNSSGFQHELCVCASICSPCAIMRA